jgi:hypothetical protein
MGEKLKCGECGGDMIRCPECTDGQKWNGGELVDCSKCDGRSFLPRRPDESGLREAIRMCQY